MKFQKLKLGKFTYFQAFFSIEDQPFKFITNSFEYIFEIHGTH